MTNEEYEINTKIGTLFCLSTLLEYTDTLTSLLEDHRDTKSKYQYNKTTEVNKSCRTLYNSLYSQLLKEYPKDSVEILDSAIKRHSDIVTDFFILSDKDQKRVSGLIQKIKKERM